MKFSFRVPSFVGLIFFPSLLKKMKGESNQLGRLGRKAASSWDYEDPLDRFSIKIDYEKKPERNDG